MNPPQEIEFPSYLGDLKEILLTLWPKPQPSTRPKRHVSRFVEGADMDEVYPHLWLGDCDAAMNIKYLQKHRITHILNCAENKTGPAPIKTGKEFYKGTNFQYLGLDLIDLPFANASKYFEVSANYISDALKNEGIILVHCRQGRSRSASMVIAFLMMKRNYTAASALKLLREYEISNLSNCGRYR